MLTINCSSARLEGVPTATASLFSQNPPIFIPNSRYYSVFRQRLADVLANFRRVTKIQG